jgi:hypothetical protein
VHVVFLVTLAESPAGVFAVTPTNGGQMPPEARSPTPCGDREYVV